MRNYFVITKVYDYDGYDCYTEFLGDNVLEVWNRLQYMFRNMRRDDFDGFEDENLEINNITKEEFLEWAKAPVETTTQAYKNQKSVSINDQDYRYAWIRVNKVRKNSFNNENSERVYQEHRGDL